MKLSMNLPRLHYVVKELRVFESPNAVSLFREKLFASKLYGLLDLSGIEPLTPCLQSRCSPS
jgi:hypothetical protein